ncbi:pinensin family lanthipeptide [Fulvivirga ulvae]|uniref:pinensin family lanthipeptide n=1 Tax=Fulvivirga ulvae TaxID=2904245 RepID=UPI001F3E576E|nr:pinensin family lanthipeptide [Fulvivirga ulvae]UII31526.1 pinensin family lanthipeptide [Fulvivirga ulvae]
MKDKKIKLEDLKVQSFITRLNDEASEIAKGGATGFLCGGSASVKIACLSQGAQICSDDSC